MSRRRHASFVVRVIEDRAGQVGGVVERVATGAKESFQNLEAIGRVIRAMLRDERPHPPTGVGLQPSPEVPGLPGASLRRRHPQGGRGR